MNEQLADIKFFDVTHQDYQKDVRLVLQQVIAKTPMSINAYARSIGMSPTSLKKFLNGGIVSFCLIQKIDRFLEGNK